jgi:hypothetical protein
MARPAITLLEVQLQTKRGELRLRSALGAAIDPECFRPEIVTVLKQTWLGARAAGKVIHRAILTAEQRGNVVNLNERRFRRRSRCG